MADPEAAVADTHALMFHAAGTGRLGTRAGAIFERAERGAAIIYVPAAVIWECSLLARVGRVNFHRTIRAFFADLFSNPAYQPVDLTMDQVCLADQLRFTRDPFDGLICAAARTLDMPLVTRNETIRASGAVTVLW